MIARIGKIRKKKGAHFEMKDCGERAKRIHNGGKVTRHQREILQIDKTQKNSDFKTLPDFSPLCSLSNPHFSDSEGVSRKKKKLFFLRLFKVAFQSLPALRSSPTLHCLQARIEINQRRNKRHLRCLMSHRNHHNILSHYTNDTNN